MDEESVSAEIISKLMDHDVLQFTLLLSVITQHHTVGNSGTARNGSTFMHLADAFIQSSLYILFQFMHSLGIKPMIFAFLVAC